MTNTLIAPNGKPSNLNAEQYALVRTPAFKKWFGDWENDPENASKVVDENGEPKVMWHGSPNIDIINVFSNKKGYDYNFFASDIYEARRYTDKKENVKPFFLNLKKIFNPNSFNEKEKSDSKKIVELLESWFIEREIKNKGISEIDWYKEEFLLNKDATDFEYVYSILINSVDNWIILENPIFQEYIKTNNYDSFTTNEGDGGNIAVYNPNNIKLADGSNTTFDATSPDIRYADGGAAGEEITCINCGWHWNTSDSDESDKYVCHKCGFDNKLFYDPLLMGVMADATLLNLKKNGILLRDKENQITLIAYNTENRETGTALYNTALIYKSVKSIKQANEIIEMLDNQLYEQFDESKIEEYKKSNRLIIMNQNEVIYDSEKTDLTYADGGLIAPNGNPSNLTDEQYRLVRTPEFKAWFGDWENDPQNASKVVDKNGEPLVVYRGSIDELGKHGFEFKLGLNLLNKKNANNFGFFFTDDIDAANKYRLKYFDDIIGSVNSFFLNERKILDLTVLGLQTSQQTFVDTLIEKEIKFDGFEYLPNHILNYFEVNEYMGWGAYTFDYFDVFPELRDLFIANGYNGIIFWESSRKYSPYKVYVAFEPTQIKLADGTNTTFDAENPDVRYATGGLIYKKIYSKGGGGYTTVINGMEYSINKQYTKGTWVAQSADGEYYDEAKTLADIKYYLEKLKKDLDNSYADGGLIDTTFYHGTGEKKKVIDAIKNNQFNFSKSGGYTSGMYITPFEELAKKYSDLTDGEDKGVVKIKFKRKPKIKKYNDPMEEYEAEKKFSSYSIKESLKLYYTNLLEEGYDVIQSSEDVLRILPEKLEIIYVQDDDLMAKGGLSKTPAPKKDRVFGSDKNKVGSAASKESAKKINLSDGIITTLSNKAKEYNEDNSGNKVSLNTLKAVMRRGMGAYSTSHRPTITGGAPNSRQAWGFARVNKFLKKKSGEKVKAAYVQDDDLLEYGGSVYNYVYIRFGLPNKDDYGNYTNSSMYFFGNKGAEEGGISVFEAIKVNNNYYVITNNSKLRLSFDELVHSKRDAYLVEGEFSNNEGADDEILLNSEGFKVIKKIPKNNIFMYNPDINYADGGLTYKNNKMENGGYTNDETYKQQQQRLIELSDNVYRQKRNIANAGNEDIDDAIQKFYDARNEYNAYQQSILDKEDAQRRDRNIQTKIEDEKEDKEKYGEYYEHKELFKKSPALAALQSSKDMVEYVKSQEYIDTLIQEGLGTEKIEERQKQRIKSYEQDVKDLEYYIGNKKLISKKNEDGGYLKADGGLTHKNNLKMTQHNYQSMKPIGEIQVGDVYLIKEDMFAPHQDHEHPQHLSTRYATVEVKSPCHKGLDAYVLEVMECDCDHAAGKYAKGKIIERSRKHILSSGKLKSAVAKPTEFKDGGELNADSQEVKEYFAHESGNAGGLLVGKRHSEGGIKADVKSTGQRIEMEGGEAVITRGAVNSKKKYVYEGKEMTTREILSDLNVKGGGVAFADGGDVPEKINCGCSSMKVGGINYTPQDFITLSEKEYQEHRLIDGIEKERNDHFYTLAKLNSGAISIEQALREIASKEMMIDPKYPYSE